MTTKDYIRLAEAFARVAKTVDKLDPATFGACIKEISEELNRDNPKFDVYKFYVGIMQRSIKE